MAGLQNLSMEHLALNVKDSAALVDWYCRHLNMRLVRKVDGPVTLYFIADVSGRILLEIYSNPQATVPGYASQDPLVLHLAFTVDDVKATRDRLLAAGAIIAKDIWTMGKSDEMVMLRDPWGLALQFIKRVEPMLKAGR